MHKDANKFIGASNIMEVYFNIVDNDPSRCYQFYGNVIKGISHGAKFAFVSRLQGLLNAEFRKLKPE